MDILTQTGQLGNLIYSQIPPMPYATHKKGECYRVTKKQITDYEYIQLNPSTSLQTIVYDCDNDISQLDWSVLPCPNFVILHKSSNNYKAHLGYVLDKAVPLNELQTPAQKRLLEIVKMGLLERLEADPAFAGLLSKNPFCGAWCVRVLRQEAYTLKELRSYIDDDRATELCEAQKAQNIAGFRAWFAEVGRNCNLFESLRLWAYSHVHLYHSRGEEAFHAACYEQACVINADNPLDNREVQDVAKKVARWTWTHLTAQKSKERKKNMSELGRKKGLATRQRNREQKKAKFKAIYDPNGLITIAEASRAVGVSERTGKAFWAEIKNDYPVLPGLEVTK